MRALLIPFFLLIFSVSAFSQKKGRVINSITYIHNLAEKKTATFADAVKLFVMTTGEEPSSLFSKNIDILKKAGITKGLDYKEEKPLRKGTLALMITQYLKLGDSLFYAILKIERYAFRVCTSHRIMDYNAGEWDSVSGGELIEIMRAVSERSSGGKNK